MEEDEFGPLALPCDHGVRNPFIYVTHLSHKATCKWQMVKRAARELSGKQPPIAHFPTLTLTISPLSTLYTDRSDGKQVSIQRPLATATFATATMAARKADQVTRHVV